MTAPVRYHAGERAAQRRAGLREQADVALRAIGVTIPPVAAEFIAEQPLLVLGAADADGRMWASLLTGPPGFAHAPDEITLDVEASPVGPDPLAAVLRAPAPVGAIVIDPSTRRRMRLNGRGQPTATGLRITAQQVYANCPKYIQKRSADVDPQRPEPVSATTTGFLTAEQQRLLAEADTFFVATRSADGAADASHRGGNPGFVQVLGSHALQWPDYIGNAMMMTLGNLQQDPAAGLLFVDWSSGTTLQVTGRARVDWEPDPDRRLPGAQRQIDFEVDRVVQIEHASPLVWSAPAYSRFNPSLRPAAGQGVPA
jgi:predicted pyridoxine 5'-phosphate oxidase superfamily flavin-nucleotide-binding protein